MNELNPYDEIEQSPELKKRLIEVDLENMSEFELARHCSKTWSMEQD